MLFKKRTNDSRRVRQPLNGAGLGAQPVFSYHARSPRAESKGARVANKLPWMNPPKPSPRKSPRNWPKRTLTLAAIVFILALLVNSLFLGRNPKIITLADTQDRQIFLRSQDAYQQAATAILAKSLANTNKLTIDIAQIAQDMQKQFPEIERVTIQLPVFGHQPVFYIQPARPALLFKTLDGGLFIVDTSGRALMNASQAPKVEKLGLVMVSDQSGLPVVLGQTALPSGNVTFITEVVSQLKARRISLKGAVLAGGGSELDLSISGKPYIVKFNMRGDARAEAGTYLAVKQYLESHHKTPGSYIDVRVDNRAYYR